MNSYIYSSLVSRTSIFTRRFPSVAPPLRPIQSSSATFIRTTRSYSSAHSDDNLSYDEFTKKYVSFFEQADDLFEVQRGLNNCFSYDLVPSVAIIEAALHACRRTNDYSTAVRVLDGLKQKCPSVKQYQQYLDATAALRAQLGVDTRDQLEL